jgi:hypothetical protein
MFVSFAKSALIFEDIFLMRQVPPIYLLGLGQYLSLTLVCPLSFTSPNRTNKQADSDIDIRVRVLSQYGL